MIGAASAVVLVAAVVAAVLVINHRSGAGAAPTTSVPSSAVATSNTGVRPFPDLTGTGLPTTGAAPRSTGALSPSGGSAGSFTSAATAASSDTGSTSGTDTGPTSGTAGGQTAARRVADAWIAALNGHDLAATRAQVCAATAPRFTEAFVTSIVGGSMKVTGVTVTGARGTVSFDYRMTTDTSTKSSHLAMVVEGGTWKVCE